MIKKVREIQESLCDYQNKPITIISGSSGIGKLYLCKEILKQMKYQILEIDSSFQEVWMLNKAYPLEYSMKDQLQALDQDRVIIVKEMGEFNDYSQLRMLQQKYKNAQCVKPMVIIVNTSITKDYQLTKILGQEFLTKYCAIIQLKSPTNKKIEKYLLASFPRLGQRVASQIAELSNGDLRNATNQAQVYLLNYRDDKQSKDSKISFFNTIGRVLYNKRYDKYSQSKQLTYEEMIAKPQPKFYFDPFELVATVQVTQQTYRGFLFMNSLKFFNDLNEVKTFYDIQCEGDMLERSLCRFDRQQGQIFQNQCLVSQVVTLGYMMTNKHVKPEKQVMLTLNGPKDYQFRQEVIQRTQEFKILKPFRTYQKDLVLAALGKRQSQAYCQKTNMYTVVTMDDNGEDQSWYEDLTFQEKSQKKQKQQNQIKVKVLNNQGSLIPRNKNQHLIDIYNELLNC